MPDPAAEAKRLRASGRGLIAAACGMIGYHVFSIYQYDNEFSFLWTLGALLLASTGLSRIKRAGGLADSGAREAPADEAPVARVLGADGALIQRQKWPDEAWTEEERQFVAAMISEGFDASEVPHERRVAAAMRFAGERAEPFEPGVVLGEFQGGVYVAQGVCGRWFDGLTRGEVLDRLKDERRRGAIARLYDQE
jgi:hypothetical protein